MGYIAFDGTYLEVDATGQSRVGLELLRAGRGLVGSGRLIEDLRVVTLSGRLAEEYDVGDYRILPMGSGPHLAIYLNALRLSNLARRITPRPDAVFWLTPERFGGDISGMRQVVMVHDLASIRNPRLYPRRSRWLRQASLGRIRGSRCRVVAISEATRRDLVHVGRISPGRITVVHHGVSPRFRVLKDGKLLQDTAGRFGLESKRFALFVGRVGPRKNVPGLLRLFQRARGMLREDLWLAMVGPRGLDVMALAREAGLTAEDAAHILVLGRVSEDELVAIYNLAWVLVFPTYYEGFGLPVLEAMACGTPVLSSDCSSIPEIAADAGLLFDPSQTDDWVDGLVTLERSASLHSELRDKGLRRAREFSWTRSAEAIFRELTAQETD